MIPTRHDQTGFPVPHDVGNAARVGRHNGQPRRKGFQDGPGHIVDVWCIQIHVRGGIQTGHPIRPNTTDELDILEAQFGRQAEQRLTLAPIPGNDQASVRIAELNPRKGAQDAGDVVVSLEISVRQKDRAQRLALAELELIPVNDVSDGAGG